jgi:hypothetical protein
MDDNEREQMISAMFASMVIQTANMAMIFLGQAPNPQTGQVSQDLDHARYFIDQLEMIEAKTKGNLNKHEESLLKQSLTNLRLVFVEAVEHLQTSSNSLQTPGSTDEKQSANAPATDEQETPIVEPKLPGESNAPGETAAAQSAAEAESKKKFSKKY